jgi:hypothetical protein
VLKVLKRALKERAALDVTTPTPMDVLGHYLRMEFLFGFKSPLPLESTPLKKKSLYAHTTLTIPYRPYPAASC